MKSTEANFNFSKANIHKKQEKIKIKANFNSN